MQRAKDERMPPFLCDVQVAAEWFSERERRKQVTIT